ncbi:hypothetical protein V6N13_126898 [Hibiscus sabdariffa]
MDRCLPQATVEKIAAVKPPRSGLGPDIPDWRWSKNVVADKLVALSQDKALAETMLERPLELLDVLYQDMDRIHAWESSDQWRNLE